MRDVADRRDRVVVLGRGRRDDPGAQRGVEPGQGEPVGQHGVPLQAEHPHAAVEQLRIGGGEPGLLGAGHRVTADEPAHPVALGECPDRALHRGHVGQHAVVSGQAGDQIGQMRQRHCQDRHLGPGHRIRGGVEHPVTRRARRLPGGRERVEAGHLVAGRREGTQQRAPDQSQADDRDSHC